MEVKDIHRYYEVYRVKGRSLVKIGKICIVGKIEVEKFFLNLVFTWFLYGVLK